MSEAPLWYNDRANTHQAASAFQFIVLTPNTECCDHPAFVYDVWFDMFFFWHFLTAALLCV